MESLGNGGSKEDYVKAKNVAKHVVVTAKRKALDDKFSHKDDIALFHIAKQIRKQNQDTVSEKKGKMVTKSWASLMQQRKMHGKNITNICLKVVSATFLLVYFVCLKNSTCETREIIFYFISEAPFILKIIKF